MKLNLKLITLLTAILLFLTGCLGAAEEAAETVEEIAQKQQELEQAQADCDAGDSDACTRAEQIKQEIAALEDKLEDLLAAIPGGLTIASTLQGATDSEDAQDYLSKKDALDKVLNAEIQTDGSIEHCLKALPKKVFVQSPRCYGPELNYENHPDDNGGPSMPGNRLPTGDLGLWSETAHENTDEACAAAKLNELITKVGNQVDLATGSMAMMVCAAVVSGQKLPENDGDTLNLSGELGAVSHGDLRSIQHASITRDDVDGNKAYRSELSMNVGDDNRPVTITVHHVPDSDGVSGSGLVTIEREIEHFNSNPVYRATSVVYQTGAVLNYRLVSANFENSVKYAEDGQVTLAVTDDQRGGDVHVMVAEIDADSGHGEVAYGWNAGGRDDYYRVLNATTSESGEGNAYYGYSRSPASSDPENLNLDLSSADAGVICNWAGPGNRHLPVDYVQSQALGFDSTQNLWIATESHITYAPTNSCELDETEDADASFTHVDGDPVSFDRLPPVEMDLLPKSQIQFNMPSTPSVP